MTPTLGDFWSGALGAVGGGAHWFLLFLEPEVQEEEEEEEAGLPIDFARICERWLSGVEEDEEVESKGPDLDRFLLFFLSSSESSPLLTTRLTFVSLKRGGNTQLQRTPRQNTTFYYIIWSFLTTKSLSQQNNNMLICLPKRASRLTHLGIGFWVSLTQTSLQKWLQFLEMRLYLFPRYSSASFSIKTLTSFAAMSVFPTRIDFLNVKPGHFFGSTSKMPVLGDSCAPNAYSTPWTTKNKNIQVHYKLY